ncbi:MAG: short chain dehydrogenase [Flavobacteriales bacterium]|nr:MAG: short chain dehydrogenase [Flavobacteriales bacterium]
MDFNNKIVWVTGASSGIGWEVVLQLIDCGAKVIASARNVEKLNQLKAVVRNPERVAILPMDVEKFESMGRWVQRATELFGGLDILINNAGISQRSLAIDTGLTTDFKIFNTNFFGTVALTKAVLPIFAAQHHGHIVVISSVVGKIGTPLRSTYAASKHALHGFFDSLRAEVYKDNIYVTIICPGYVQTDISRNALSGDGTKHAKMDKNTANGLSAPYFVNKMLRAIAKKRQEVVIGGRLETAAIFLKRFFPKLLAKMVRKKMAN